MLTRRTDRPNVLFRRVVRQSWGPEPQRVVVLALLRQGDRQWARVLGDEGGVATELEVGEGAAVVSNRPLTIRLADGTEWQPGRTGCSCNVPASLRGLNPLAVP